MHLYFIRHAQSINNELYLKTGSGHGRDPDPDLSDTGHLQKEYLAEFLKKSNTKITPIGQDRNNIAGFGITHIYSSLMIRAIETGMAVSRALNIPLEGWIDLHENGGIVSGDGNTEEYIGLPGNPRSYFERDYPDLILANSFGEEGWWNRPLESEDEKTPRARGVIKRLLEKHENKDDRVVLITHGGFYNRLIRILIDPPDDKYLWFKIHNTGVTRIDFREDKWGSQNTITNINYMNRVDFLPLELVTP